MLKLYSNHRSDNAAKGRASLLRAGVSAAALACLSVAAPAWAQDAPAQEDEGEAIVVKGYRASLQSAQQLKKNSDVIVDSITAEDISALPDRSVTEALQRIPGVAIDRFSAGLDPDHFSVEGSGVVVRGLTYVRSEFNGREAFTANNGRALSFADVPSEMLGGVDVFKTPTADRIEGGISGVVNLRTRRPFDFKGLEIAGSAEVNYGDFVDKATPTGSILISNRWETPIGEFGLLANFSYSQLKSRADRLQLSSFRIRNQYADGDVVDNVGGQTPTKQVYFPRGAVLGTQEFNRERYGYAAAAQWKSNDGSVEIVAQFLRSDARQAWTEHTVEIATDNVAGNGDSRASAGTKLSFDADGMFQSGTITGPTGWRGDQNTGAARTPMLGLQSNNIRRDQESRLVTDDYGLNVKWDVSDRLGLVFDYQHVDSSTYLLDNTIWASTYQDASISLNGGGFPTVAFGPPQVCSGPSARATNPPGTGFDCSGVPGDATSPTYFGAGHNSFADPYNSFYRAAMDHIEQSDGNSDSFRLDLDYAFPDSNFLKSVQFGARYSDRDQTSRFSQYNWGVLSEQWGNNGPIWMDTLVDGDNTNGHTQGSTRGGETFGFDNFFRGAVANPLNGQPRLFYGGHTVNDYAGMVAFSSAIAREWQGTSTSCADGKVRNAGWNPLANRCGVVAGTPFLPGEINPIREQNYAAYAQAKFRSEFSNGWTLSGTAGVRYTKTDRDAGGYLAFPNPGSLTTEAQCASVPVGQDPPALCTFPLATRDAFRNFQNGAVVASEVNTSYEYWLPSVNVKLEVGGGLQFRAAYFAGVSPPPTGLIRNFFNVSVGTVQNVDSTGAAIPNSYRIQGTFNAGNPYLRPTTADNFDLTAEWYFSNVGQLTFSAFYKELHGVLTNDTVRLNFTNNGATFPAIVTTPNNSSTTGKIKGFEVSYQQTYDFLPGFLKGLGLQANYTFVDSSGVPQSTLSATDPDVAAGRVTTVDTALLPLQGLSKHTFNITPFIDIGPFSARLTYSWRSEWLLTVRDVITPFDPIMNESTGQLDASMFFAITPNIKLGVQGVNLTNEITKTSAVISAIGGGIRQVPRGYYMNDRRYTAIIRFNF